MFAACVWSVASFLLLVTSHKKHPYLGPYRPALMIVVDIRYTA